MTASRPPSYVNTPVAIVYAETDDVRLSDGVIVTMTRILGLCWSHNYERTPPLTPDQLSDLVGRPRTTLYRHLAILENELGWLRIEHRDRRLVLRPRVSATGDNQPASARTRASPPGNDELRQALAAAGIENPARDQLARDDDLDPAWVRAWQLWTHHPHRANLSNPAGLIVRKLQSREPPPDDYLRLATLTDDEAGQLRASFWTGGRGLHPELYRLHDLFFEVYGDPRDA